LFVLVDRLLGAPSSPVILGSLSFAFTGYT
jgi:hypothetical protein